MFLFYVQTSKGVHCIQNPVVLVISYFSVRFRSEGKSRKTFGIIVCTGVVFFLNCDVLGVGVGEGVVWGCSTAALSAVQTVGLPKA
jgi:hypothetical protein